MLTFLFIVLFEERIPGKFNYPSVHQSFHPGGQCRQQGVPQVQLSEGGQVAYLGGQALQYFIGKV